MICGQSLYFNTILLQQRDVDHVLYTQTTPNNASADFASEGLETQARKRLQQYYYLGLSIPPLLQLESASQFMQAVTLLLVEFDYYTSAAARQKIVCHLQSALMFNLTVYRQTCLNDHWLLHWKETGKMWTPFLFRLLCFALTVLPISRHRISYAMFLPFCIILFMSVAVRLGFCRSHTCLVTYSVLVVCSVQSLDVDLLSDDDSSGKS